ncbi:iron chelate uptake ABC transporter family permease subunit [Corynebacterium sp. P5848]|uniref:FecCD family ABC transporter permease n=1 Tax=Corynebacterium marambiense TaxID=2765364 RepID=UPI002260EC95|nr:iron chelate uptake ABC transporter family permease subunit [Corynebacterium marambiense]MCX7541632.1 iron chelate uptake ABC transporter family permease subunit [Corynebacterium marambiense]
MSLILMAVTVLVGGWGMAAGPSPITVTELVSVLLSGRDSTTQNAEIVWTWRLPRTVTALAAGAALGVSGAIFQSVTRNPLGSPDIIGFNTGAYTGALIATIVAPPTAASVLSIFGVPVNPGFYVIAFGALIGGLTTAALVLGLSRVKGLTSGYRLIVVGIAVSAVLHSLNMWIIMKSHIKYAISMTVWGFGSLNGVSWPEAKVVVAGCVSGLIVLPVVRRTLTILEMNDSSARGLGVNPDAQRIFLVVVGVLLTAAVTSMVGPIIFVALAAPQIARRLTASPGPAPFSAALTGAVVLGFSDCLAQVLPTELPAGVITISIGGVYLLWLLTVGSVDARMRR